MTLDINRLKKIKAEATRFIETLDVAIKAIEDGTAQAKSQAAEHAKTGYCPVWICGREIRHFATAKRRSMDLTNALVDFRQGR